MVRASHLDQLNPAQRQAVVAGVAEGAARAPHAPLLVIAGAGTGKTKVLAHRVAHLVLHGADPARMLLLTFTRRAALEMVRRVEAICARTLGRAAPPASAFIFAGTFHAVGLQLLRLHASAIGLNPAFTVLDRVDSADLTDLVRDDLGLARTDRRFPRKATCLAIYSHVVNAEASLDAVLAERFPWCAEWAAELRALFGAYVEAKQRRSLLDYDDLLLWWERMLSVPALADAIGRRFDFVLVDEYQDTNGLQERILRGLKPDGRGVTVVGDDAQAIYGFRAATVRNILDFPRRFEPAARIVRLEHNYRSLQPILDAANGVMALAAEGFAKTLFSTRPSRQRPVLALVADGQAQVGYVIERVLENREAGILLREQAVLFRTAHHGDALQVELTRRNIPFVVYGGLRFLEAAHVKDVLAILRLAHNPGDPIAAFRVLQLLPGIGPKGARRALAMLEPGDLRALASFRPPAAASILWPRLLALLETLAGDPPWEGQIGLLRRFYEPLLPELYDLPQARLADLAELERIALTFPSRERFLADLTLHPPEALGREAGEPRLDEDYLILSTIHSAKGQEWKAVFLLNVVDGCIPSDMATGTPASIDEERRVLYVAMTRARDQLHLIQPLRFHVGNQPRRGDRHVRAARSRFIPDALLPLFELHVEAHPPERAEPAPAPLVDLGADLRAMWS